MRRALILLISAASAATLAGCNAAKDVVTAASAAKTCATINVSALDLSQNITIDAFASGKASATQLSAIDKDMATLRNDQKGITAAERVSLTKLLDDAGSARASLAAGTKVDAAVVSEDQAALARSCITT